MTNKGIELVDQVLAYLQTRNPRICSISIKKSVTDPIILKNGLGSVLPYFNHYGLYLLVASVPQDDKYDGELLYVGKTNFNVYDRIKGHMQAPSSNEEYPFINHRWMGENIKSVPPEVKMLVAQGNVKLHLIGLEEPVDDKHKGILPELVEKEVLIAFAHENGRLPYLNMQF